MTPQEYEEEKKFVLSELADHHMPRKLKESWYAEDLTKHFKDDLEVMTACIPFHPAVAASTASPRILDDKEFAFKLVTEEATFLHFLSDRLRDDLEVVEMAVTRYANSFDYASDRIKNDPLLIARCCKDAPSAMNFVDDSVKESPEKMLLLMKSVNFDANYAFLFASENVLKLCPDNDPIKSLESHLLHEKLQTRLAPKASREGPKMKI